MRGGVARTRSLFVRGDGEGSGRDVGGRVAAEGCSPLRVCEGCGAAVIG